MGILKQKQSHLHTKCFTQVSLQLIHTSYRLRIQLLKLNQLFPLARISSKTKLRTGTVTSLTTSDTPQLVRSQVLPQPAMFTGSPTAGSAEARAMEPISLPM